MREFAAYRVLQRMNCCNHYPPVLYIAICLNVKFPFLLMVWICASWDYHNITTFFSLCSGKRLVLYCNIACFPVTWLLTLVNIIFCPMPPPHVLLEFLFLSNATTCPWGLSFFVQCHHMSLWTFFFCPMPRHVLVDFLFWVQCPHMCLWTFVFLSNTPTTCPCALRGPPSWAWQQCNRLLRLGRPRWCEWWYRRMECQEGP